MAEGARWVWDGAGWAQEGWGTPSSSLPSSPKSSALNHVAPTAVFPTQPRSIAIPNHPAMWHGGTRVWGCSPLLQDPIDELFGVLTAVRLGHFLLVPQ